MRPHTSPEVLLGSKSPTMERLRRASRRVLAVVGLRPAESPPTPDDLRFGELQVGDGARSLAKHLGDEALTRGVRLRRQQSRVFPYTVSAAGKRQTEDYHMTDWSITVTSRRYTTARLEITQSDIARAPEHISIAEGGAGRRAYEPGELTASQSGEMFKTVAAVLGGLHACGEIEPLMPVPVAEAG